MSFKLFGEVLFPPARKVNQFHNFVRAWNGKIYSVATAQLIYAGDKERLYKHSSGDYFLVWEPLYEDFDYKIYTKEQAKRYLEKNIENKNLNYIIGILKSEFEENIDL